MRYTSQTGQHHHETLGQFSPDPAHPYKSAVQVLGVGLSTPDADKKAIDDYQPAKTPLHPLVRNECLLA